jgi:phospholipid N-methyltransferase
VENDVGWLWDSRASSTKARLKELEARPKRALGQNFVTDDNILQRIITASGIVEGDLVLEIGPGTGNLTKHVLKVCSGGMHIVRLSRLCDEGASS